MNVEHGTVRPLVLATDLDGTLLAGPESDRMGLRRLFSGENGASLIFATGRGVSSIEALLGEDPLLPSPGYIIGDVGATVVRGGSFRPIQPLQDEIAAQWSGRDLVQETLKPFTGLVLQEVSQERRCSFVVEETDVTDDVRDAVESIGCDLLFSRGRYLDILPKGVSKGATLGELLALEELDPSSVVVAGDSINDLSLFSTGLKGIVVGNAEPALLKETAGFDWVYQASRPGASGIRDGLRHHGFLDQPSGD